jgi:hypothetical protein
MASILGIKKEAVVELMELEGLVDISFLVGENQTQPWRKKVVTTYNTKGGPQG